MSNTLPITTETTLDRDAYAEALGSAPQAGSLVCQPAIDWEAYADAIITRAAWEHLRMQAPSVAHELLLLARRDLSVKPILDMLRPLANGKLFEHTLIAAIEYALKHYATLV